MVSIPIKWAKKYNFKRGDSVEVEEKNNQIIISSEKVKNFNKISLDARELEERPLRWIISSLHRAGYDEIEITYKDNKMLNVIDDLVRNLLLGFIISDQNQNKIILKSMSSYIENEFDTSLRRAFLATLSLAEGTLNNLKNKLNDDLSSLEKSNNQLTNFCERILNLGIYDYPKTTFLYSICWNLEKIGDEYKYIFQSKDLKPVNELIDTSERINIIFREYYELFYNFDIRKFNSLYKKCKNIENELENVKGDFKLKCHLFTIVNKLLDFSSNFIGLKYKP